MRSSLIAMSIALFAGLSATPAMAQQEAAASAESDTSGLSEIVVTAQRRAQNLQEVPIAVTAFNGEALESKGVAKISDLQQVDSSLFISQQSGVVIPFLRGIGNPGASTAGNEASVPVYIDDVYFTRLASAQLELGNIERVEVLKGPQGTLFGRNATGGLMHIITRDPGDTPRGSAMLGYGNYDTYKGSLYFSTPIGEGLAADLSLSGLNQRDGWGKNLVNGLDTYRRKFFNARSKIVIEPTDTTKIRLSGFYIYQRTNQGTATRQYPGVTRGYPLGSPLEGTQFLEAPNFFDLKENTEIYDRHRGWGGSARIDQELGFADLTSITAYRRAKEALNYEGDHTELDLQAFLLNVKDRQFTQELQLKSKPASPVTWIVGAFYLYSKVGFDPTTITGSSLAGGGLQAVNIIGIQTLNSYSGFGQATFPVVGDRTNVTLGLRYTKDEVEGNGRQTIDFIGGGGLETERFSNKTSFKKWTYKVGVDHHFTDDVMAYATWSRGYKSGTFNTLPLNAPPTDPETVTSYELGLKTTLFDRRLRANIAIFRNDVKSPQVQLVRLVDTPGGPLPLVFFDNADKARTKGVEFDSTVVVADGLTIDLSGQYLDAKFISFQNAPFNVPIFTPPFGAVLTVGDASGNRLSQTSKWKLNAGFNYEIPTSAGEFTLTGVMSYRSNLPWDPDNIYVEPSLTLFNASIKYKPEFNPNLSFRLWGSNLTNEKYFTNEIPQANPAGPIGAPGEPRTYGIEIRYEF